MEKEKYCSRECGAPALFGYGRCFPGIAHAWGVPPSSLYSASYDILSRLGKDYRGRSRLGKLIDPPQRDPRLKAPDCVCPTLFFRHLLLAAVSSEAPDRYGQLIQVLRTMETATIVYNECMHLAILTYLPDCAGDWDESRIVKHNRRYTACVSENLITKLLRINALPKKVSTIAHRKKRWVTLSSLIDLCATVEPSNRVMAVLIFLELREECQHGPWMPERRIAKK